MKFPPWPVYAHDEREVVDRVLKSGNSNYWTGNECRMFEREFADYHGAKYGIALANGTVALELALIALGIDSGDEVIVTPRSFFASASCIVRTGATPVFADVDRDSQNITPDSIREVITDRTKAIIAVHLAGWPCDMPGIMELAREYDLFVVEDCAQAHGATIDGKYVGSFGEAAAFSFCQDKIMSTAGEGGMLLTNDKEIWSKAWSFKDHGKSWDKVYSDSHAPGFRWLHSSFGTNWRMTEIQGAIGRIQLKKLDGWIRKRRQNAEYLRAGLSGVPALRTPAPERDIGHAYYKFYAFVDNEALANGWDRDRLLVELEAKGCPGLSGSCSEIYREDAFRSAQAPELPVARMLGEQSVMLPVHPTLEREHLDHLISAYNAVLAEAI